MSEPPITQYCIDNLLSLPFETVCRSFADIAKKRAFPVQNHPSIFDGLIIENSLCAEMLNTNARVSAVAIAQAKDMYLNALYFIAGYRNLKANHMLNVNASGSGDIDNILENYKHVGPKRQKRLSAIFPDFPEGEAAKGEPKTHYLTGAGQAARLDLLYRDLFVRSNSEKRYYLSSTASFFKPQLFLDQSVRYSENDYPSFYQKLPKFEADDYLVFEYRTGTCFLLEAAAALCSIKKVEIREICQALLCAHMDSFLAEMPFILTRIEMMRQFLKTCSIVLSLVPAYEDYWRDFFLKEDGAPIDKNDLPMRVGELVFERFSTANAYFYQENFGNYLKRNIERIKDVRQLDQYRDDLLTKLDTIGLPNSLGAYIKSPIFGPPAFCDPSHEGVTRFLDRMKEYAAISDKMPQNLRSKEWQLFLCLAKTVANTLN